jgi:HK97 family phage major capsid protein/HK97 family phage prohead protease
MTMHYRTSVSAGEGMEFVISDGSLDRHGTRLNPNGWELANFKRNPIALFGHSGGFPIGRWENVRVEGSRLIGKLVMAAEGTSARIDELRKLVEQGILRAVSVGFSVLEYGVPGKSQFDYERQELHEVSLVAVGSNTNALAMARSLNISDSTLRIAFGEYAEEGGRDVAARGGNAGQPPNEVRASAGLPPIPKVKPMKTLSQRIEDAQNDLNAKRDRLAELNGADDLDIDAIEELTGQIDVAERAVTVLKASEAKIGMTAGQQRGDVQAPALNRRPLGVSGPEIKASDLIVRAGVCHLLSHVSGHSVERIMEERYHGHEATAAAVQRTAIAVATTTTSGWASQLVQTAMAEFLALLPPTSIYPAMREMGVGLTFGPNSGSIKIPFSSNTDALAGGFVLEGDPIPVGRMTLDSTTLTPHKFGIIVPMTKEVMKYTNPALEAVVRSELLARTAIKLDSLLVDANAGNATRPAGLLNGVAKVGDGYGGGDYIAFIEDINALMAPFDTANAGRAIALLMNPKQARRVRTLAGPNSSGFGWAREFLADFRVIVSTSVPAGTLIAVDTADFATGTGDSPIFEASDQATIHMDDAPAAITTGGGPTVATPVRSMFQTNSVALKMYMDVTWAMRRAGMVQWVENVTW